VTDERIMLILRRRVGLVLGGGRIGFRVESRVAVDKFLATFLATEMITPLAWPDESSEDAGRYYAVTFETPDATRVEIAWVALLVGFILPYSYASYRRGKRFEKFEELLPRRYEA